MTDTIARQVRRLTDEAAIRKMLATVCHRLDEYDVDAFVDLFTDDCRFLRGLAVPGASTGISFIGAAVGRGELKVMVGNNQARYARTHHQIGNIAIELHEDEADCVSNAICWHREHDGNTVVVYLRYFDRVICRQETWKIADRQILAQGVDGTGLLAEGPWEWVKRSSPAPQ